MGTEEMKRRNIRGKRNGEKNSTNKMNIREDRKVRKNKTIT